MTVTAAPATVVRARGLTPLWAGGAVAFLLVSLFAGVVVGPIDLGVGAILESTAAKVHVPGASSLLTPTEEAILWRSACRASCSARSSAGCSPLLGRPTRACSGTAWRTRTCWAWAAGAGLGATIAIAYLPDGLRGQRALPVAAFLGGSVAVVLTYAVGRSARRERDAATLVLAGVTVAAFFTAWQTFLQQQNADTLQQAYTWIWNVPSTRWTDVVLILPYVAVAAVVILALRRVVDVLALGDDEAATLGVHVGRVRLALVVAATLGTAAAVAVTGLIGFVGIIVPHAIRLVAGIGYRALLPLSAIVGAGFLVLADVVARTALSPPRSRSASSPRSAARRSSPSSSARRGWGRRAPPASRSSSADDLSSTPSTSRSRGVSGSR